MEIVSPKNNIQPPLIKIVYPLMRNTTENSRNSVVSNEDSSNTSNGLENKIGTNSKNTATNENIKSMKIVPNDKVRSDLQANLISDPQTQNFSIKPINFELAKVSIKWR